MFCFRLFYIENSETKMVSNGYIYGRFGGEWVGVKVGINKKSPALTGLKIKISTIST